MSAIEHVVVGGGHYIMQNGEMVQQLVHNAPNMIEAFRRGSDRVAEGFAHNAPELTRNIQVITTAAQMGWTAPSNFKLWVSEPQNQNVVVGARRAATQAAAEGVVTLCKHHHHHKPDHADKQEKLRQQLERHDQRLNEQLSETAQALGYGMAGDIAGFYEHGAAAAGAYIQDFGETAVEIYDSVKGLFGKD